MVFLRLFQQKDLNLVLSYDDTINEIQDVLESLIAQGQHAWAPYISNWSIKTLGTLSKKYKRPDGRGIAFDYSIIPNCFFNFFNFFKLPL